MCYEQYNYNISIKITTILFSLQDYICGEGLECVVEKIACINEPCPAFGPTCRAGKLEPPAAQYPALASHPSFSDLHTLIVKTSFSWRTPAMLRKGIEMVCCLLLPWAYLELYKYNQNGYIFFLLLYNGKHRESVSILKSRKFQTIFLKYGLVVL